MDVDQATLRAATRQVAIKCGVKVVSGFLGVFAVVGLFAWLVEHQALLLTLARFVGSAVAAFWVSLLWLASFGGSFWGAVALASVATAVAAWALCVRYYLDETTFTGNFLVVVGSSCLTLWLLSVCAGVRLTLHVRSFGPYIGAGIAVLYFQWFLWGWMALGASRKSKDPYRAECWAMSAMMVSLLAFVAVLMLSGGDQVTYQSQGTAATQ